MDIKNIHNVYFLGIGGIGMSALARYFSFIGKRVAGYDKTETPLTKELSGAGMAIHYEDSMELVPEEFLDTEHTLVVYTPAVPKDHMEWQYFRDGGFTVMKRAEVLGIVTRESYCLAVAGTHGKTTTSSILAHLLKETGTPITAFLGGISEDLNSNFLLEGTEVSVVEADEFDRSFLQLSPDVACITSMDADHLDIYGNAEALVASFKEFAGRLKTNGKLFVRMGLPLEGITYGLEEGADFRIVNLRVSDGGYLFDIQWPGGRLEGVRFNKPGQHNLLNGLVAFGMALQTGAEAGRLAKALASFKGVQRRFSYRIKREDLVYIDDYAHHPTEINAVYDAVREMHPGKKVVAVFQPHLFSRTRDFADGFASSLQKFDRVLLLDIYPAREKPMEGVTSEWLLGMMENPHKKLVGKQDLVEAIKALEPEVLVTMGAGDIGLEVEKLEKAFGHEN
ncbi:MAG: UDP-N-acetylmuramate--L-alanine ligase [Sediminicola sp.]|tara:strand:- start:45771 stop:47123 length:1353 start_codon:yes stop_codon:yes gene_type:complete